MKHACSVHYWEQQYTLFGTNPNSNCWLCPAEQLFHLYDHRNKLNIKIKYSLAIILVELYHRIRNELKGHSGHEVSPFFSAHVRGLGISQPVNLSQVNKECKGEIRSWFTKVDLSRTLIARCSRYDQKWCRLGR